MAGHVTHQLRTGSTQPDIAADGRPGENSGLFGARMLRIWSVLSYPSTDSFKSLNQLCFTGLLLYEKLTFNQYYISVQFETLASP